MNSGLTDIHQHLLWGLDDGPGTMEGTQEMLREAHRQGIAQVAATCHACPGFAPFDAGLYRERLAQAQDFARQENLAVTVLPGVEAAWTYQTAAALRQGKLLTLGHTDCVLLELWRDIPLQEARDAVTQLIRAGYRPVLAHVERYRCFAWWPTQALRFREETGALMQVNASTLMRPRGLAEKRFVRTMLRHRAMDAVATDAHGNPARPVNLRQAHDWLLQHTDGEHARMLTTFAGELK